MRTTTTPDLNRTPYSAVQQSTDGGTIPGKTVVLPTADWREAVSASKLDDATTGFLARTDFASSYVVGFEVEVTEAGYHLRLESVERAANRVRIAYSDVLVETGPNVERSRAMFVRLPKRDGAPETVELNQTDQE